MDRASDGLRDRQKTQKSGVMSVMWCTKIHSRSWQILAAWHSLAIGSPGISKFHEDRGPGAGDQKDGVGRFHQQGGKKHRRCIGDGDVFDLIG